MRAKNMNRYVYKKSPDFSYRLCVSTIFILVLELKLPESIANNIHPRLVAKPTGKQDAHEKLNHT